MSIPKYTYPDWLNAELFNEFLQMRIEAKQVKVNTQISVKRLINKLSRWRDMGYDVDYIIEYATEKQWRGLYLPPGLEPKQTYEAKGEVAQMSKKLAKNMEIPPDKTSTEKQRYAQEQRLKAKQLLGLK